MKLRPTVICILIMLSSVFVLATPNGPISVAANDHTTVSLFFPDVIKQVIAPSPHYRFEYEPKGTFGTLQADQGAPSNLTVITEGGHIYSFYLRYEKEVDHFTYVLSPEESIGTIMPTDGAVIESKAVAAKPEEDEPIDTAAPITLKEEKLTAADLIAMDLEPLRDDQADFVATYPANSKAESSDTGFKPKSGDLYEVDRMGYYEIFCENNYEQKRDFDVYGTMVNRIGLQLNNIVADRDELYFVMEIQNNSWSDYKVKQLQFFVKTRELQTKLQVKELYRYQLPEKVAEHSNHRLVFVCKKFKLASNQKIYVLLEEEGGRERSVLLPLENAGINRL